MASKAIAARHSGDDYQGRFFWYQAAQLLFPDSPVARVRIENREVPHVDDVTVIFREPGRRDVGRSCFADHYQVKFHVDQADAYSHAALMDPAFIGSKNKSLLQRFYAAFELMQESHPWFTLGLVSNWRWRPDDALALSIRNGGQLADDFFEKGAKSNLGTAREEWRNHVGADDVSFRDFATRLRFKLNYFGIADLNVALNAHLQLAGLVPIDFSQDVSPYDDLIRKLIISGDTDFDAAKLRQVCEREGLLQDREPAPKPKRIGFRTFVPFADVIETETDSFVCGADLFDGRHPKNLHTWPTLEQRFSDFVTQQRPALGKEHDVLLDCHASAALVAGNLLTTKAAAWPVGPRPGLPPQRPTTQTRGKENLWTVDIRKIREQGAELAVAVSLTHKTSADVLKYLTAHTDKVGSLLEFVPADGHGAKAVRDADHAIALAAALVDRVRSEPGGLKHLFIAGPNFFSFYLGQRLAAMGDIVAYEFDFDGPEPREYRESVRFPLKRPKILGSSDGA